MSIRLIDKFVQPNDRVTVTRMGNITELQYMEKCNREAKIRKIDKYTYEVLSTGEIKQFNLSETRKDNINSLRQTFKRLAYMINTNFSGRKNEFWLTLTYAEKEYDPKKIAKDYNLFMKRLKYQTKELGEPMAICVKEPHADGSWHIHMLLKYPHRKKAYIANERLAEIWGHGFVKINHIKRTDNLGAYLTAYLTDVSLDELEVGYETSTNDEVWVSEDECSRQTLNDAFMQEGAERIAVTKTDKSKAVIKGGRLAYYPVGMKIYTTTGNLSEPERIEMDYEYAKESGLTLEATPTTVKIPKSAVATVTNYKETVTFILERFGYSLFKKPAPKKARPAKARHKWTKEVSQIPFYIDTRQSKATVFWQKRNEMLIKAGATMMPEAPLNKDGSVGFSARFGEKLRDERKGQFKDFVTTEDIVLKSVNEVGLFLYFAGTNSWLELVDENGKTLNEWTVVE